MSVQANNVQETIDALNRVADALQSDMPANLDEAAQPMYFALSIYPEQRPGSKYERTGDLEESTYSISESSGATASWTLGQTDAAANWVGHIDNDYQAWMHVGVWETAKAIKDRLTDLVFSRLSDLIDATIKRYWGG